MKCDLCTITPVFSESEVDYLMECANWAPTHGKTEPWRYVVISGNNNIMGRSYRVPAVQNLINPRVSTYPHLFTLLLRYETSEIYRILFSPLRLRLYISPFSLQIISTSLRIGTANTGEKKLGTLKGLPLKNDPPSLLQICQNFVISLCMS